MLDLTIYLIKKTNAKQSLDSYIKTEYINNKNLSKYYIDKEYLEESDTTTAKIYLFEEDNYDLSWASTINTLAKSKKKIIKKRPGKVKSLVLIEIKKRIFALSFSNGISLIEEGYLENNFGIKTNRKMIDKDKLKSIKSISLSEGVISNHKYAKKNIPPQSQLDHGPLSIVSNIKGPIEKELIKGVKITVSGQNQIQVRVNGEIDFLKKLIHGLNKLLSIYLNENEEDYNDKFYWGNEIKRETDIDTIKKLDKKLADKIKLMIKAVERSSKNQVSRSTLQNIEFYPDIPYEEENPVSGYSISGIGYPKNFILPSLDEILIFSKLAIAIKNKKDGNWSTEEIISKLKSDNIHYYLGTDEAIYLSKVYNSLYFETVILSKKSEDSENEFRSLKYILIQGKWHEVPKDFYDYIEKSINDISRDPLGINYIDFTNEHFEKRKDGKIVSSEGKYNIALSEDSKTVLFDKKNYGLPSEITRKYKLVKKSAVEPCDILAFKDGKLQFIHIKKGRSGAGVSHLLNQAFVSSTLYKRDPEFLIHLNKELAEEKYETIDFNSIEIKNVVVILACIVEPNYIGKTNSTTFPLLTAVSIINTVTEIKDLGFDCRLIKIPDKYNK